MTTTNILIISVVVGSWVLITLAFVCFLHQRDLKSMEYRCWRMKRSILCMLDYIEKKNIEAYPRIRRPSLRHRIVKGHISNMAEDSRNTATKKMKNSV